MGGFSQKANEFYSMLTKTYGDSTYCCFLCCCYIRISDTAEKGSGPAYIFSKVRITLLGKKGHLTTPICPC